MKIFHLLRLLISPNLLDILLNLLDLKSLHFLRLLNLANCLHQLIKLLLHQHLDGPGVLPFQRILIHDIGAAVLAAISEHCKLVSCNSSLWKD